MTVGTKQFKITVRSIELKIIVRHIHVKISVSTIQLKMIVRTIYFKITVRSTQLKKQNVPFCLLRCVLLRTNTTTNPVSNVSAQARVMIM